MSVKSAMSLFCIFDWGPRFSSVDDLEILLVRIIIGEIERADCSDTHHRMPEERQGDVRP